MNKKNHIIRWAYIPIVIIALFLIGCSEDTASGNNDESSTETENVQEDSNTVEEENTTAEEENIESEEEEEEVEPEPLPIPDPIVYEGSGDDVIKIEPPEEGPIVLSITGNAEGRHFAVKGFDDEDNSTVLFVNTSDPYEGITLDPAGETTLLEISANGSWTIESQSVRAMRVLEAPGTIEGTGDEVILVEGDASIASVEGNEEERHFAVKGYNPMRYLIVNTSEAYSGNNRIEGETILIEVNAVDDWSITLE